jgi:hypothetical protein
MSLADFGDQIDDDALAVNTRVATLVRILVGAGLIPAPGCAPP